MKLRLASLLLILLGLFFSASAHAAVDDGTIDPYEDGNYLVHFLNPPDVGNGNTDDRINFGKFSTAEDYNIHITDDGLYGFAWGVIAGYIVMSCDSTSSGCNDENGRFEVDIDRNGTLYGFAWGENTGWINFGPFENNDAPQVQIDGAGYFRGVGGDIGYAWSENYGWIEFNCTVRADCLRTDYRPVRYRPDQPEGTVTQCSNSADDDNDGFVDDEDPECIDGGNSEYPDPVYPIDPTEPTEPGTPVTPPSQNPGTPGTPGAVTPGGGEIEEPAPADPGIPIITPVIDTITNVVTIELPEARDRVIEFLRMVIAWIQTLFDAMNRALAELMADPFVQTLLRTLAIAGLIIVIALALALFIVVPVAGAEELLLFPYLLWQNLLVVLGITPAVKPWGIVYDSATHRPVALAHVTLTNSYGAVAVVAITQSDGSFSAAVPDGAYTLRIDAQNAPLGFATAAPLLYNTIYSDQPILIRGNQPVQPFDVPVQGGAPIAPVITSFKEFLLYHEVALTNGAFLIFGIGLLASVLHVIFFPSLVSLLLCAGYVLVALFRAVGVFGSYASVFLSKAAELPIDGKLITVFEKETNTPVVKALSSVYGRAYLNLPDGTFYAVVSDPGAVVGQGTSTVTAPFSTRAGLFRKRFGV
ncbi:MAG TPA: carboxypeptidase regulatory-like domain-containing protein [Candidatus Paceibacterota bacterium]